ncbi:PRC1 [Symbiodinium sp. KB8]|nr:PRC1 [Symbiodinium sp. KB8]
MTDSGSAESAAQPGAHLDFDVTGLAATTVVSVRAVWEEMGMPTAEQEQALAGLVTAAREVFTRFSDEQKEARDEARKFIADTKEQCLALASSMHLQPDLDLKLMPMKAALESRLGDINRVRAGRAQSNGSQRKRAAGVQAISARRLYPQIKDRRLSELNALQERLFELQDGLGDGRDAVFAEFGDMLTLQRVGQFKDAVGAAEAEHASRAEKVDAIAQECRDLWALTGTPPSGAFAESVAAEGAGHATLGVATDTLTQLRELATSLATERESREGVIKGLGADITRLWDRLDTPAEQRDAFRAGHDGLDDGVIAAVKGYLEGLQGEYSARMGELVEGLRGRIREAQAGILLSPEEAAAEFGPAMALTGDDVTEDTLEEHEAYLAQLQEREAAMAPLLRGVERREKLLADKAKWQTIIADPTRLTSRGRRGAARLEEEKLERRVRKELPAVTAKLRAAVAAWEADQDKPFVINGQRLLDALEAEAEAEAERKEAAKNKRKAALGAGSTSRASSASRASIMSTSGSGSRAGSRVRAPPAAQGGGAGGGIKPPSIRRKPKSSGANATSGIPRAGAAGTRRRRPSGSENTGPPAAATGKGKSSAKTSPTSPETRTHTGPVQVSTASKTQASRVLAALGDGSADANAGTAE